MTLSTDQLEARKGKLTASRVAVLMKGDAEGILQLYQEMIGEGEPENLDHVWPVRLGSATEALNLDWFEMKNGALTSKGSVLSHKHHPWAAATLDAWWVDGKMPCECKHVGGREPLEVIIERYQPQMQWQMEVTGAEQCALSVIMGANEPIVEFIPRDAEYAAEMVKRGKQFMDCVARRVPPVALPAVAAPVDASKVYDMRGDNRWATHAADWLASKDAADTCKDAEKVLKSIVPEDAKKCHGYDVQITRDRAGRLSLRKAT
jgi:putative phage-type endonuclease